MWAIPLKYYSRTITNDFPNKLTTSKRKLLKIEPDRGTDFLNSIFQNFFRSKNIQHFSRFTDKGPSIAKRMIKTLRNFLKNPVFLAGKANWISELTAVIIKCNNTSHQSIKKFQLKPVDQLLKKKSIPVFNIEELNNNQFSN